jgi:hypothetical protein
MLAGPLAQIVNVILGPEDAMSMSPGNRARQDPEPEQRSTPMRANRRVAQRKRQRLIDGFVSSARMPTRPCTVCDMSSTGSRVELWGDNAKPLLFGERVTLYIPSDRQEIDAEVVWRQANVMGLRFTSAFRAPTRPYG